MRIALLHYSAQPAIGGVEKIMAAHARLFRDAGHDVKIICRTGEADLLLKDAAPYAELKRGLEGAEVILVHNVLTMPFDMEFTAALWRISAEEPQRRWIAWIHDLAAVNPHYEYDWSSTPWNRLSQACERFKYVAISSFRARQFEQLTGRSATVIPNGIDPAEVFGLTEAVAAFASRHQLIARDLLMFQPARLLRRKNVEFGIDVIAELRRRGRDAVLLITAAADRHNAKSRQYEDFLRERRRELQLVTAVLFVNDDFLPNSGDTASLYKLADALFFPSTQEGFGLPILEAALHRLPGFCADLEPMNRLLESSAHYFDPSSSPGEVATLIERTITGSATLRAKHEVLQRYSWSVIWEKHLAPLLIGGK